jgi:hypothetical protein
MVPAMLLQARWGDVADGASVGPQYLLRSSNNAWVAYHARAGQVDCGLYNCSLPCTLVARTLPTLNTIYGSVALLYSLALDCCLKSMLASESN